LETVQKSSADIERNTDYFNGELTDDIEKLYEARRTTSKKKKESLFYEAREHIKDDIAALIGVIKNYK